MSLSDRSPALVFFDVDGTLLNEQKQIPASAVAAIRLLRKNGHRAFLNTGRTRAGLHPHILDVQWIDLVVPGVPEKVPGTFSALRPEVLALSAFTALCPIWCQAPNREGQTTRGGLPFLSCRKRGSVMPRDSGRAGFKH